MIGKPSINKIAMGLVSITLLVSSFGCTRKEESGSNHLSQQFDEPLQDVKNNELNIDISSNTPISEENYQPDKSLSTNWEDYKGDLETFVYGLIIDQLKHRYDVFPASTTLSTGEDVYGIAYTDYEKCYANETNQLFESGFLPFAGENEIPDDDFNEGLLLNNLDYTDSETSFLMKYGSNPFTEHCVVYGKYVQYGVDKYGRIFYDATDYERGKCDESLGSLFSYDNGGYVFDTEVGNYVNVTGSSLYGQIDYDELQKEINRILETQDNNFSNISIETCAYYAQEAVISYLLSHQEETFLGYNAKELIKLAKELNPLECYRITNEGISVQQLIHDGGASGATRWIVGTCCVMSIAVSCLGSVVVSQCPFLSSVTGATAGISIELFMQVVCSGEPIDKVDWNKVLVAAIAGAASGYISPYVLAKYNGLAYFAMDSIIDGFVGGFERAVIAWMDGEEGFEVIKAFGKGFALGSILSASFKAAGNVAEFAARKLGPGVQKLSKSVFPKLTAKISVFTGEMGKKLYKLKDYADSSVFHSEYISRKISEKQLQKIINNGSIDLADEAFKQLSSEDIYDNSGRSISKDVLRDLFDEADDNITIAYFKKGDEIVEIVKKNGMVGIVFDNSKYQTVSIPGGLTKNRDKNFNEAAKVLIDEWKADASKIPDSIASMMKETGNTIDDVTPEQLVKLIQKSDMVIHENIDMLTITLAPRELHKLISHMGGVGLAKFLKCHMGMEFFEQLVSFAATGGVQYAN